jgi:hypothetical protein
VRPIPYDELAVLTHTDASGPLQAVDPGKPQAGQLIGMCQSGINDGGISDWTPLWWKSGKLKRATESTLGSEVQSMSRGAKEMLWIQAMLLEIKYGTEAAAVAAESKKVQATICIDAKSAYDNANSHGVLMTDKENSLDMVITKQTLQKGSMVVRWIPRTLMLADGLTKDDGVASDRLRAILREGRYRIGEEQEALDRNRAEKERRLERGKKRLQEKQERDAAEKKKEGDEAKTKPKKEEKESTGQ